MQNLYKYFLPSVVILLAIAVILFDWPFYLLFILFILIAFLARDNKLSKFDYLQQILATSKISAVSSGLVEIVGLAKPIGNLVNSPIGNIPCIAYIYTVEEKRVRQDADGDKHISYVEVDRQLICDNFYLQDESGQIKIDIKLLEWFYFTPANEYQNDSYRYREYILDQKTKYLIIGRAWYENNQYLMKFDDSKQIFGIAPLAWVSFRNKWRPLKVKILFTLAILGLYIAFILITPISFDGENIIFDFYDIF